MLRVAAISLHLTETRVIGHTDLISTTSDPRCGLLDQMEMDHRPEFRGQGNTIRGALKKMNKIGLNESAEIRIVFLLSGIVYSCSISHFLHSIFLL